MKRVTTLLFLLAATACSHGESRESNDLGFAWDEPEIAVGHLHRGTTWNGELRWRILGARDVELLGVQVSCGCLDPTLQVDSDRHDLGKQAAGAAGSIPLKVHAAAKSDTINEVLRMAWRYVDEERPRHRVTTVTAHIADAWLVEPPALNFENLAHDATPDIVVRWTALTPITGRLVLECDGHAIQGAALEECTDSSGRHSIEVRGRLARDPRRYDTVATIRIVGLSPLPPPVPVNARYAPRIRVEPNGVLELTRGEDGEYCADVLVVAESPELAYHVQQRGTVQSQPEAPDERFACSFGEPEGATVRATVRRRAAAAQGPIVGTLKLVHGIVGEPCPTWTWYIKGEAALAAPATNATKGIDR